MKIGILAPLFNPVPPPQYGGAEVVVSQLAEGLVTKGHDVSLFASGDSHTSAKLVPIWPKAFSGSDAANYAVVAKQLIEATSEFPEIELWSSHISHVPLALAPHIDAPIVTTLHGIGLPERQALYELASKWAYFISISQNQQSYYRNVRFAANVYNGVDSDQLPLGTGTGDYFVWMGRFTHKKGPVEAIELAKAAGVRLKLAAPLRPLPEPDQPFFDEHIKPRLSDRIEYVGAVGGTAKAELLGQATGLLSPLSWDEPFGLVPVEAMACGTPVLTVGRGAMPELVQPGVTGWLSDTPDGLAEFIGKASELDRAQIRQHVLDNFTVERMIDGYEQAYQSVLAN